jgi:hypothetical protein
MSKAKKKSKDSKHILRDQRCITPPTISFSGRSYKGDDPFKGGNEHLNSALRVIVIFLQTDYPELYEEAVSRSLTILLPDIRQDIFTPFSTLS